MKNCRRKTFAWIFRAQLVHSWMHGFTAFSISKVVLCSPKNRWLLNYAIRYFLEFFDNSFESPFALLDKTASDDLCSPVESGPETRTIFFLAKRCDYKPLFSFEFQLDNNNGHWVESYLCRCCRYAYFAVFYYFFHALSAQGTLYRNLFMIECRLAAPFSSANR